MYGGNVSWRDPRIAFIIEILGHFDKIICVLTGRAKIPPYAIRIRSNGIVNEFGGQKFITTGKLFRLLICRHVVVSSETKLLDIGCSCGRLAYALYDDLGVGGYTGFDIDNKSLEWASENRYFADRGFEFHKADVYSDIYNPNSQVQASDYTFPMSDSRFDVVVMYSVATHLLEEELRRYLQEIYRMLKPEGRVIFSVFFKTTNDSGTFLDNTVQLGKSFVYSLDSPRKAVAFEEITVRELLDATGFDNVSVEIGTWRSGGINGFDQDFVVARKPYRQGGLPSDRACSENQQEP
ncbi:Methyltransferase type 11 [Methylorubrum extorquens CM4]|uniref:Methyltransferase type 11 n=2 Tax=Methylorubrum extorquens TaxID=408 RepID=B7L196_METC4|nr:class I SAM-dependent methyltransferase [Methylorubrum extorquens]ACK85018.1 Methyltransferase type 11 [Methylorubrum extorquens CM4]